MNEKFNFWTWYKKEYDKQNILFATDKIKIRFDTLNERVNKYLEYLTKESETSRKEALNIADVGVSLLPMVVNETFCPECSPHAQYYAASVQPKNGCKCVSCGHIWK